MNEKMTHINENGEAVMVDVSEKGVTARVARAAATVRMRPETLLAIQNQQLKKGDALAVARVAGIMAAKRTWELIPLCHNIPIEKVEVDFEQCGDDALRIIATAKTSYKTGIEMEALTAANVAALTIYDLCKAIDRGMTIENVHLLHKSGGKSGEFNAE